MPSSIADENDHCRQTLRVAALTPPDAVRITIFFDIKAVAEVESQEVSRKLAVVQSFEVSSDSFQKLGLFENRTKCSFEKLLIFKLHQRTIMSKNVVVLSASGRVSAATLKVSTCSHHKIISF